MAGVWRGVAVHGGDVVGVCVEVSCADKSSCMIRRIRRTLFYTIVGDPAFGAARCNRHVRIRDGNFNL